MLLEPTIDVSAIALAVQDGEEFTKVPSRKLASWAALVIPNQSSDHISEMHKFFIVLESRKACQNAEMTGHSSHFEGTVS